jgi:hypothetical protein
MSSWKHRPKCSPTHSLLKLMHNLNLKIRYPRSLGYIVLKFNFHKSA